MPGITYIYEALGRLAAVVDRAGDTGIYAYDSVGNLLSIERQNSSVISIIEFTPKSAPAGAPVTIHGTGFETAVDQNAVTFNGLSATVVSATSTHIATTVPFGAASGPITVTTPTGSGTSRISFTVTPVPDAPGITDFSPTIGTVGTQVTIRGTHFDRALAKNKVMFNRTVGILRSSTATAIETEVPPGAGSGRIAVSTPFGRVLSGEDLFVPPVPRTAADVEFTSRIVFGESATVRIGTPNKIALVVFDGTVGQRVSAGVRDVRFDAGSGFVEVSILRPEGTTLTSKAVGSRGDDIDTEPLPESGTYAIVVDLEALTGSLTLTLSEPVTAAVAIDGPPVAAIIDKPGQDARITFQGTAEQRVDLGVSDVSFGAGGRAVDVFIIHPDGTTLTSTLVTSNGRDIHTDPLPDTGTYTIVVDPQDATTVSVTLTLSQPVTGAIAIGGSPLPVIIERPGQNARVTFEGTTEQRVDLGVSDVSFGLGAEALEVSLVDPVGTTLASQFVLRKGRSIHTDPLPHTGTHTIVVDPQDARTVSLTLTLSEPLTGALAIGGSSVPVSLRPGQQARVTFESPAGQRASLGVTEVSFGTGASVLISILKPDETALVSTTIGTSGGDLDLGPLADAGIYTIVADPVGTFLDPIPTTARLTLILSEPASGAITIGGSSVPIALERPGQDARLTFGATAGQRVRLGISDVRFDIESVAVAGNVSIIRPNGTTLASTQIFAEGSEIEAVSLPDAGTYTVAVDPGVRTVQLTLILTESATDTRA